MSKVKKTDHEWRSQLSDFDYKITREAGTEIAFTGEYWDAKDDGIYNCKCCNEPLFTSETKYDSGSGWPSFYEPINLESVELREDRSLFMQRVEVLCAKCQAHLGHVFPDGPQPTGMRFCMNSASLKLEKVKETEEI